MIRKYRNNLSIVTIDTHWYVIGTQTEKDQNNDDKPIN